MPTPHRRTKGRKRCTEQRDIRDRHASRVCRPASSTALADRCHRAQSSSTAAAHRAHGLQRLISRYFESRLTCQLRSPLLRRRCAIEPGVPLLKQLMKRSRRRPLPAVVHQPLHLPVQLRQPRLDIGATRRQLRRHTMQIARCDLDIRHPEPLQSTLPTEHPETGCIPR